MVRKEHRAAAERRSPLKTRGADAPRLRLRYSLEQDGRVIKSGEARLSDVQYLQHRVRYTDNESLRHEKALIDQWFGQTFDTQLHTASR